MLSVTTTFIPGCELSEAKGAVFSEQAVAVNVAKDAINWVKGMLGGSAGTYAEEYEQARKAAVADLERQAAALGADAVIGLTVHYSQFLNSDIIIVVVTASGTAVTIQK